MLTGDSEKVARQVASELGIDEYYAGLLPADKVTHIERLLAGCSDGKAAFVGDGINDAPVLSRADIGIVYQNIVFAIGIKLVCLAAGALGLANMWFAIFADVGVMVLAVLNAIRALFVKNL